MPGSTDVELAARLVAALYHATGGQPRLYRRIDDCAAEAGIDDPVDVQRALTAAARTGFLMVHIERSLAMLTPQGLDAVRWG